MDDHPHDYSAEVVVCSVCHRTEADITRSCHHCSDGVGRCWWCLRDAARAKDAEAHAAALAAKDAEIASLSAQVQQWRDHVDRCAEIQNVADLYRRDPLAMADAIVRLREDVGALRAEKD